MKRLYSLGVLGLTLLTVLLLAGQAWMGRVVPGAAPEAPSSQSYPYPSPIRSTGEPGWPAPSSRSPASTARPPTVQAAATASP